MKDTEIRFHTRERGRLALEDTPPLDSRVQVTKPPGSKRISQRPDRRKSPAGVAPATRFHRTYLPHFEAGEVPQHICFRLADSLPSHLLRRWDEDLRHLPESKRLAAKRRRVEEALDKGLGACWLRRPEIASLVAEALMHFAGVRYRLHAWVVMPNHVHVLVTLLDDISLSSVLHSWKSYTVRGANALLRRRGPFWQPDYFDRFVRDERHYRATVHYIHHNPVKAELCRRASDWRWGSAYGNSEVLP